MKRSSGILHVWPEGLSRICRPEEAIIFVVRGPSVCVRQPRSDERDVRFRNTPEMSEAVPAADDLQPTILELSELFILCSD